MDFVEKMRRQIRVQGVEIAILRHKNVNQRALPILLQLAADAPGLYVDSEARFSAPDACTAWLENELEKQPILTRAHALAEGRKGRPALTATDIRPEHLAKVGVTPGAFDRMNPGERNAAIARALVHAQAALDAD